jgi:hypothetical protein
MTEVTANESQSPEAVLRELDLSRDAAHPAQNVRGVGPGWGAMLLALGWTGAAIAAPVSVIGSSLILQQPLAVLGAIAIGALAPASMILMAASAAREAKQARADTLRLTQLAELALSPGEQAEDRARRLGFAVRSEIGAIQTVVNTALDRFEELEQAASRNAHTFEDAVASARDSAGHLTHALESEREAFRALNDEMYDQTKQLGDNVWRQVRLIREAARLVRTEFTAADEAFQHQLTQFATSATVMAERTDQFHTVLNDTRSATERLDVTMSHALDALAQATSLTDTARQSAESAALAANATASAVRDTTQRAVADARRVAQLIRQETLSMEESAAATLERLRQAAQEAHRASAEAQAAADHHAASINKRLSAMAETARIARPTIKPIETAAVSANVDAVRSRTMENVGAELRTQRERLEAQQAYGARLAGAGRWDNLMPPPVNDTHDFDYANDSHPIPIDDASAPMDPEAMRALSVLAQAGIAVNAVFKPQDLDHIASRARAGAAARRNAVHSANPNAVDRLRRHLKRDTDAQRAAQEFRAKPHLATDGRDPSLLVAYLLLDTASA